MQNDNELRDEKRKEFNEGDNLSKLQRRMYSRERRGFLPWRRRRKQSTPTPLVKDDWEYDNKDIPESEIKEQGTIPSFKKESKNKNIIKSVFVISVIFFIVAIVGAVVYMFINTAKIQTAASVRLSVEGVTSISSGDLVELQVLVVNDNDKSLELSDLIIEYPDGTVSPANFSEPMLGERIPLGKIEPHSARRGVIRAVLFGNNGDTVKIKIELEYRLNGSSALLSRSTQYDVLISGDALGLTIDGDTEINPGQSTIITVGVKSYASTILNGVYLDVLLPFGVTVLESSPDSVDSISAGDADERWILGTLKPGKERQVYLSVSADSQIGDIRNLQFITGAGLVQNKDKNAIEDKYKTVLAEKQHTLEIKIPFLSVNLLNKGQSLNNAIAYSGREMNIIVKWKNNLKVPITDAAIKIVLGGEARNRASVKVDRSGFYRSVDDMLIWDYKTAGDKMKVIAPGEQGQFSFKIRPISKLNMQRLLKPELTFDVNLTGKRLSENNVPELLVSNNLYKVKVATDVSLDAYALYDSGPFSVVGAIPPKVEYETQYSVTWEVSNTTSEITDVVVRAELPHYVRWVGLTTPANEQLIYNKVNRTLEWNLGKVKDHVGVNTPTRKISFALGLVPSLSQLGTTPNLLFNQVLTGTDSYTGVDIEILAPEVTTKLKREPGFNNNNAAVVN